jgi:hypothetical protein
VTNKLIKLIFIFLIVSFSNYLFAKENKFEKKLKKDLKKLSKFTGFIDDTFKLYDENTINDYKKSIVVIYSHGSKGEAKLDHCNKGAANVPEYIRNLHNKKIGEMTINIYRLCNGVRGLIEPQWDRVHKLADEGNLNGFIELVDYDGMKIYDKLKQTNKQKIISNKIDELIKKGFENIILAGHSCGAWASIALAGQFPEKIKGTIATNPACRGRISDRLNYPWPAWDAYHEYYVNKFFIQPAEINSLIFIHDKDPWENSETLNFFFNKKEVKIINYTNFNCEVNFGATAHAFPVYPKEDNCFAKWENKNNYIIDYLSKIFE